MIATEKMILHQAIDSLSSTEISIILKMIKGLLNENQIEEIPQDEIPRHLKILDEMNNGDFINLKDISI